MAHEGPGQLDDPSMGVGSLIDRGFDLLLDVSDEGERSSHSEALLDEARHRGLAIECRRLPAPSLTGPDAGRMTRILDEIEQAIAAGRTVLVHCPDKPSPLAAVIGCFLLRQGFESREALERLEPLTEGLDRSAKAEGVEAFVRAWSEPGRLSRRERFRGCLLGLAAGDAVGTTLEFKSPGGFDPIEDMVGGGPFRLQPGEWTDDTSMALCLATSLLRCDGFDPADQMERYVRWREKGYLSSNGRCFDIGNTVGSALEHFKSTGEAFAGSVDPRAAGNGSIMRLAPVPMRYAFHPAEAISRAAESSRTTHGAPTTVDACRYFGGLLVGALNGVPKSRLLDPPFKPTPGTWDPPLQAEIAKVAGGSFKAKHPPEIRGTGYVVDSLEAALWALHGSSDFRGAVLSAVNLGDDADTTGAVVGQLAGALYGEPGIPERWRDKLAKRETIESLADQLFLASFRQ